jgi:hypothetical protein
MRSVGWGTHVPGAWTNELVVAGGYEGVGDPSGAPAEGEHGGRRIGREAGGFGQNNEARIEGGLEPQLLPDDFDELIDVVGRQLGLRPTVDAGLVVLAESAGLPTDAAPAMFALGRSAGWIAHALEAARDDQLIRPRARYVGPPPH